jgi:UDP-glucose 4-epimerase
VFDVKSNLLGTIQLLTLLDNSSVKKLIYASSGGTVYGNPIYLPIDEKHPIEPIGSYGITKSALELYIKMYAKKLDIDYFIVRPSNPFGPGQRFNSNQGVVSSFLHKTLLNQTIEIWGDGSEIRDYIYISDFVNILIQMSNKSGSGTYNVGSGIGKSVIDILETVSEVTGVTPNVVFKKRPDYAIREVVLDIDKISSDFKWSPSTSLLEGVKKHYNWIKTSDR